MCFNRNSIKAEAQSYNSGVRAGILINTTKAYSKNIGNNLAIYNALLVRTKPSCYIKHLLTERP